MKKGCYLLIVHGDVDPQVRGPYPNDRARLEAARKHREQDGDLHDGTFRLDVAATGKPSVSVFTGAELE